MNKEKEKCKDETDELYQKNPNEALLEKDAEKEESKPKSLNEGEKLMCINFCSSDQKIINYSVECKNTDLFNTIENKLYKDFPEYYDTKNYFIIKGIKIDKNKSLEENNIHNNDMIILNLLNI